MVDGVSGAIDRLVDESAVVEEVSNVAEELPENRDLEPRRIARALAFALRRSLRFFSLFGSFLIMASRRS